MLAPNLYLFCSQMYPKDTEQLLAHKSCLTNICWINESSLKSHGIGIIIILLLQKKKMRHTGGQGLSQSLDLTLVSDHNGVHSLTPKPRDTDIHKPSSSELSALHHIQHIIYWALPNAALGEVPIGPAVTREQSPAFLRNSPGRLDLPGPTQEAAWIPRRNSRIPP